MKILYLTAQAPYGKGETFIIEEMLALEENGADLLIIPRNPSKKIFHKEAEKLLKNTAWLPLINKKILIYSLKTLFTKIFIWKILYKILTKSRNPWILIKNLTILPKALFLSKTIKRKNVQHIHAHWGSTTSTMAYVISQITNISWSFTLHRWDIKENNLLKEKVKSAEFVRCISMHGKNELTEIVGNKYLEKIYIIHMGTKIPDKNILKSPKQKTNQTFQITTPANLLEVKGHKYLIEAISCLLASGIKNFKCTFYGNGPLKEDLEKLIKKNKLSNYIKIHQAIPHEKLINMYKNREVNLIVLPSINTKNGAHEGIPISLMEAMVHKIPVISTNTGGIPELLSSNAGIMVEEKNPKKIAKAIEYLIEHPNEAKKMGENGRKAVLKKYNWENESKKLLKVYKKIIKN